MYVVIVYEQQNNNNNKCQKKEANKNKNIILLCVKKWKEIAKEKKQNLNKFSRGTEEKKFINNLLLFEWNFSETRNKAFENCAENKNIN